MQGLVSLVKFSSPLTLRDLRIVTPITQDAAAIPIKPSTKYIQFELSFVYIVSCLT